MKYTREDLVPGFKFRELKNPYSSIYLIQTISKVYRNEYRGMRVLCERTKCGVVEFKLEHLLECLNNESIKRCYNTYEIY